MDQIVEVKGVKLLASAVDGVDMNGLRDLGDQLKEQLGEGVIVLASSCEGKVNLIVMATDAKNETGSACRKSDQEHCRQSRRWRRRTSKYGTGGRQKSGWYFGGDRRGKNST